MNRAMWTAWGLLVVVVDLPVLMSGWDLAPDLVGLAWILYGTWGLTGLPWTVVRVASLVGAVAYPVTGTPLFSGAEHLLLQLTAGTMDTLVWTALVTQLATGVLARPGLDERDRNWAGRIRIMGVAVGVGLFLGLFVFALTGIPIYQVMLLASVVVGMLAVVMLSRVARSGALHPATPS